MILDGANSRHEELLGITAAKGVTIADLTVQNVKWNGIKINSDRGAEKVTIHNGVIHNVWQRGVKAPAMPEAQGDRGPREGAAQEVLAGRVPRIARLMALAIRCDELIREGVVASQSEIAEFGHITTARMTQIMVLLNLVPHIQEQILFLPRTQRGRDPIIRNDIRPIAQTFDWNKQRRMWAALCQAVSSRPEGAIT